MNRLDRQVFASHKDERGVGGSAEKTPPAEEAILNTGQIRQILNQDRLSEFPILEMAAQRVRRMATKQGNSLQEEKRRIIGVIKIVNMDAGKPTNDEELLKFFAQYIIDMIGYDIRSNPDYSTLGAEQRQSLAGKIWKQADFLFDNFAKTSDLLSAQQKTELIRQHQEEELYKRGERERRSEELLTSKEAAGRWLYGVARSELEHSGGGVADAARNLARSERAMELIRHHNFNLFQYADEEFKNIDTREQDQRRDRADAKLPVAVLLQAFATPRTIRSDARTIQDYPVVHLLQTINFWLNARFTAELPSGVYAQAVEEEDKHKQKQRERSRNRGAYFDELGLDIQGDKGAEHGGKKESSAHLDSNVAVLWWDIPLWKQWKLLKPYIREEIEKAQSKSRGFVPRKFLEYINGLVSKEVQATRQKQGGISTNLEKVIRLQEIKELFNVDFVMSPKDRAAEIKRRQNEQAKQRLLTDRFRFRW